MDEKSIKVLEIIMMFGPIVGPDILMSLEKSGIKMNVKTLYSIIDKWNYFFSQIGDGSLQITGQRKIGYQLNHAYFSSGQRRFLEDAITSSVLLDENEKKHTCDLIQMFPKSKPPLEHHGFLHRLSLISKAIEDKKTIKFSYFDYDIIEDGQNLSIEKKYRQSGNLSKTTYLISPYEIMMNRGQYYVMSYCDKHPDNVTIFRLDRMDMVQTASYDYFDNLKEIVDYEAKKKQMIHMFIGTKQMENVKIKFNKDIFKTIIDEFGTDLHLSKDIDGNYLFELDEFAISEGLISWILMMGDKVEVIAPESLKQTIYERLSGLMKKYQGGN